MYQDTRTTFFGRFTLSLIAAVTLLIGVLSVKAQPGYRVNPYMGGGFLSINQAAFDAYFGIGGGPTNAANWTGQGSTNSVLAGTATVYLLVSTNGVYEPFITAVSGTNIDLAFGPWFSASLATNVTFAFTNVMVGDSFAVILTNTGGFTVTWPTNITWLEAYTPAVDPATNAVNLVRFKALMSGQILGWIDQNPALYRFGLNPSSVPFGNSLGQLTQDSQFNWDATNHRLGVGISVPLYQADVTNDVHVSRSLITSDQSTNPSAPASGNITWYSNGQAPLWLDANGVSHVFGTGSGGVTNPIIINGLQVLYLPNQVNMANSVVYGNANSQLTTGTSDTFVGINAGTNDTTGYQNTFVGHDSGRTYTIGHDATFVGDSAGKVSTANGLTGVGSQALLAATTAPQNTAVGFSALTANVTGANNTAVGYSALNKATGGSHTAVGNLALAAVVSGVNNTAVGDSAANATTGSNNTAVGFDALLNNTSSPFNVAVGSSALAFSTGGTNTSVGHGSLFNDTTGSGNTALGYAAGLGLTTGSRNALLGYNVMPTATTGANDNTILGYGADATGTGTNNIIIGSLAGGDLTTANSVINIGATTTGSATTSGQLNIGGILKGNVLSGDLTVATAGGNGNILLTPNGTGNVGIGTTGPRYALDIGTNTPDSNAGISLGADTGGLTPFTILYTRRLNYGDQIIGKNLGGVAGADTYKTLYTKGNGTGYNGIEFRYGGDTVFYGNNGATTASAVVTPSERMRIVGLTGNVLIGGTTDLGSGVLQLYGDLTFSGARTLQTSTGNLTLATAGGNGNILVSPNGTGKFSVVDRLQVDVNGLVVKYNNIATVSGGIAAEFATVDTTGLTANVTASTLYVVPAAGVGMYRVSAYLVTTTAASIASTMPNAQVVFTDTDSNTSVTLDVSPVLGAAGMGQSGLLTANTTGTVFSGTVVIYVKASTTIQYQTVNYASNAAGMAYALHIKLEAL